MSNRPFGEGLLVWGYTLILLRGWGGQAQLLFLNFNAKFYISFVKTVGIKLYNEIEKCKGGWCMTILWKIEAD